MSRKQVDSFQKERFSENDEYILTEVKDAMNFIDKMNLPQMKYELGELARDYQSRVIDSVANTEIIQNLNICSNKIDQLKDAILALAQKLDAENVANLDTDYEAIVQEKL